MAIDFLEKVATHNIILDSETGMYTHENWCSSKWFELVVKRH